LITVTTTIITRYGRITIRSRLLSISTGTDQVVLTNDSATLARDKEEEIVSIIPYIHNTIGVVGQHYRYNQKE